MPVKWQSRQRLAVPLARQDWSQNQPSLHREQRWSGVEWGAARVRRWSRYKFNAGGTTLLTVRSTVGMLRLPLRGRWGSQCGGR